MEEVLIENDRVDLAYHMDLKRIDDGFLFGTSGKIIGERVKYEIMKQRLRKIFESENL